MPFPPSLPRLPLVPDPLRRIRVPDDLEAVTTIAGEEDPGAGGMTRDQVDAIWGSVVDLYRTGIHPAAQLCLRRNGHVLIDRAIGHARGNGPGDPSEAEKVLATTETPFCIFSASKAVTATVVHLLDERGALHIGDRVADYIPEYGTHGKDVITIAQVLSHRAAVPSLPATAIDLENVADRQAVLEALCQAKPLIRPGKLLAYHALSGGFILGEIVHRVTGQSIRDVLESEILRPLGFRWMNYGVEPDDIPRVGLNYVTGPPLPPPLSTLVKRVLVRPLDEVVEISNQAPFLTVVIPAGNVITSANELSRFFELLRRGGELDGMRVLEERTMRRALAEQSYLDIDFSLGFPTRFSLGFMLGAKLLSLFGRDTEMAFGHLGLINMMGWADPERGLSAALITSGKAIIYPELPRFYAVMQGIASQTPKLEAADIPFRP